MTISADASVTARFRKKRPPPSPPDADLSLVKPASVRTVRPGGQVTYTLAVDNHGPGHATGVTVKDAVPAGLSLHRATASRGSCEINRELVCRLGDVPHRGGALVEVTARVATDASGTIVNEASVSGDQRDPHPHNNRDGRTITVMPLPQAVSDLVVTKHVNRRTAVRGQRLRYTITVTNKGPGPAADVRLTDTPALPVRVGLDPPRQGHCRSGPPLTCTLGTLRAGAHTTVTITAATTVVGVQTNTAATTSKSRDPHPQSNVATARTTIKRHRAGPSPAASGHRIKPRVAALACHAAHT